MLISHAQNFEDVILWRALKHVERGFYVDIGAQDPVKDSVSLFFYETGWRGVHVEPSPHFAAKLRAARPDEEVIGAVVGRNSGLIKFYESITTGLSTGDPVLAEQHIAEGFEFQEISAPGVTLAQVLDGCDGHEIHWLKVDVEGFEAAVIDSWLPSTVRPWIVLVESVKPGTHEPTFAEWEPTLVGLGYDFVYFDGLNRFYLSEQHPELAHAFGPGANLFDGFELSGGNSSPFVAKLESELASSQEAQRQLAAEVEQRKLENQIFQERLAAADQATADARDRLELETRECQRQLVAADRATADARGRLDVETRNFRHQLADTQQASFHARQQLAARIAELDANARQWLNAATSLQREVAGLRGSASWRITAPLRWVHSKSVARLPAARNWATAVFARRHQSKVRKSDSQTTTPATPSTAPETVSGAARIVYEQLKVARLK
jgi:FkbM family methyltransferase